MDKIVIIGGGGHAKVVISILKKINTYEIVGYTDIKNRGEILGVKYIGNDSILKNLYKNGVKNAVLGLGFIKSNKKRKNVLKEISNIDFNYPAIISNNSVINEDVTTGMGTVIMDGVVINSGTKIGNFCIINTRSSIDHDCIIKNHAHIAPGVTLSGGVEIGDNVLIGTGANIIQYKKVVDNAIIGAGSTVVEDINESGLYGGIPTKLLK